MKVNPVGQSVQTQQTQRKGRKTEPASVKQGGDKVEISSEARKLQGTNNLHSVASKSLKNTSDVREDKIAEVRQRIVDGFYDQNNISSSIADKLLKEFGI